MDRLDKYSMTIALLASLAAAGCGGGSKPGDKWFRGVVAGSDDKGDDISGVVDLLILDPSLAERREPGTAGADASKRESVGEVDVQGGKRVEIRGTWQSDGSFVVSGHGWSLEGNFEGRGFSGTFSGPGGASGDFAGADSATQDAARYCGHYSGSDTGVWNFVVAEDGSVHGSYSSGSLHGSATGDGVKLSWSEEFASGKATGTVDGNGKVHGTWSGEAEVLGDNVSVSGSWSGSTCGGPAPPARPSSGGCSCRSVSKSVCFPCGMCCFP